MTSIPVVGKAFAYVTNDGRLLLFTQPNAPEAGVQVPAGTIKPGESPEQAALREAAEETGLAGLRLARFLGETMFDMTAFGKREIHRRWFFHVLCPGEPPEAWGHAESDANGTSGDPIPFAFFWAPLSEPMPRLNAGHDHFLPLLLAAGVPA